MVPPVEQQKGTRVRVHYDTTSRSKLCLNNNIHVQGHHAGKMYVVFETVNINWKALVLSIGMLSITSTEHSQQAALMILRKHQSRLPLHTMLSDPWSADSTSLTRPTALLASLRCGRRGGSLTVLEGARQPRANLEVKK